MYRYIEILCKNCQHKEEKFIDYPAEWDNTWECSACKGESKRTISTPAFRDSTSASFLDGTDRGQTFNNLKMAAKLKVIAADLPPAERSEVKKEIRKLGAGTDDL